jgi:hypothetical protein
LIVNKACDEVWLNEENTHGFVDGLVFRNGGGIDRAVSVAVGCGLDSWEMICIDKWIEVYIEIFILPGDGSSSSIIFDANPTFVWHESIDRKNPLKKNLVEVRLSSRRLSNSKTQRWQART